MRWTESFIPTLKESPADAEIPSHKLLLRAGLVRKLTGGLYTFLPLGLKALRKVERIVREEMDRAGGLEVLMPAMQPPEIWQKSGRYESASDVLFKVRDRARKEWLLGPTHEEVITSLVAGEVSSYRQLPLTFYQIQTKFRDEIRPRFGLMRAKEFVMKDAYSFDATDEAAQDSYQRMYEAYVRIFRRCGLQALPVEADTGVMGGKFSHEFMVPADSGENEMVFCPSCDYAANIEKATSQCAPTPAGEEAPLDKFATPGIATIEQLTRPPHSVPGNAQIKTLVYLANDKPVIVLLRGDHALNESKWTGVLGTAKFRPATEDEILAALGAHPGSLGAVGVSTLPVYADTLLEGASDMTTGANEDGFHVRHVSLKRDIPGAQYHDLRTVQAGESCARCGEPLAIRRAIEVGHVFKLGTKYSESLNALFLNENGKQSPCIMGCYGIGVTRTLQAVIEQSHDKDGIRWPLSVAPFTVCITALNVDPQGDVMKAAEQLYLELGSRGIDVILDDRDERPGIKFKDSELVGFPIRVGIGEKSLAEGMLEVKPRGGELAKIPRSEALEAVLKLCQYGSDPAPT